MLVSRISAAALLAATAQFLSTSGFPLRLSSDARAQRGILVKTVSPPRASSAGAESSKPRWRRQAIDLGPDDYWNNADILYYWQTPFETYENVRVLGPLQPQSSPLGNNSVSVTTLAEPTAPEGLVNSLGRGQDPSITSVMTASGPLYYAADSDFLFQALVRTSNELSNVNRARPYAACTFSSIIVTSAPDLARWGEDRWVYTISSVRYDQISSFISQSDDPVGAWGTPGLVTYLDKAIKGFDGHVFTHPNGKRYILWSDHATLVIAEMLTSTTLGKPSAVISMMGEPMDRRNFWNNEAPTTVIAPNVNGSSTINLVFSTGDFRTPDYTTRVLVTDASNDPLIARSWTLQRTPVLATNATRSVYGPGSASFFDCESNRKCIAYSAWLQANTVDEGDTPRSIRIQHVDFNEVGELQPMMPIIPTSFAN